MGVELWRSSASLYTSGDKLQVKLHSCLEVEQFVSNCKMAVTPICVHVVLSLKRAFDPKKYHTLTCSFKLMY